MDECARNNYGVTLNFYNCPKSLFWSGVNLFFVVLSCFSGILFINKIFASLRPSQENVSFPVSLSLVKVGHAVGKKRKNIEYISHKVSVRLNKKTSFHSQLENASF